MLLKKQWLICGLRYAYTEKQIVMLNLKSVGYCAHLSATYEWTFCWPQFGSADTSRIMEENSQNAQHIMRFWHDKKLHYIPADAPIMGGYNGTIIEGYNNTIMGGYNAPMKGYDAPIMGWTVVKRWRHQESRSKTIDSMLFLKNYGHLMEDYLWRSCV